MMAARAHTPQQTRPTRHARGPHATGPRAITSCEAIWCAKFPSDSTVRGCVEPRASSRSCADPHGGGARGEKISTRGSKVQAAHRTRWHGSHAPQVLRCNTGRLQEAWPGAPRRRSPFPSSPLQNTMREQLANPMAAVSKRGVALSYPSEIMPPKHWRLRLDWRGRVHSDGRTCFRRASLSERHGVDGGMERGQLTLGFARAILREKSRTKLPGKQLLGLFSSP